MIGAYFENPTGMSDSPWSVSYFDLTTDLEVGDVFEVEEVVAEFEAAQQATFTINANASITYNSTASNHKNYTVSPIDGFNSPIDGWGGGAGTDAEFWQGASNTPKTITSLAIGASDNTTFVGDYTLTSGDISAASVTNQATVTAKDPGDVIVTSDDPSTGTVGDSTVLTLNTTPTYIEFEAATAADLENAGGNLPSLLLSGTLAVDTEIDLTLGSGGTGTPGTDYTFAGITALPATVTATIPAATYTAGTPVTINSLGDVFVEALNQTTANATAGSPQEVTFTPTTTSYDVTLSAAYITGAGSPNGYLTVGTTSGASDVFDGSTDSITSSVISKTYSISLTSGTLYYFAVNASGGQVWTPNIVVGADVPMGLAIIGDTDVEGNETIDITIENSAGIQLEIGEVAGGSTISNHLYTITDDEDDIAPPDPTDLPDLIDASDLGTSNSDNTTSDNTPTFDVECTEIGAEIQLYSDNPSADTLIGTHTCVAIATEQVTTTAAIADGEHSITYTNEDAAGNESAAAGPLTITVDATIVAPTVDAPTAGGTTNGTVSGSGGEEGDTVTVTVQTTGETCSVIVDSSGEWSCVLVGTPADGPVVIDASVTDTSGNSAGPTTVSATVDNNAPSDPTDTPDLVDGSDTGGDNTDNLTSNNTPDLDVECTEANATVNIYSDNSTTDTLLGTHTCVGTGTERAVGVGIIPDGTHNITTTVEDPAGNESAPSPSLAVTIDTTPDAAPGTPDLTAGSDTGTLDTDDYTADNTPTIDVACIDGSTVTLYTDNPSDPTVVGSAVCSGSVASITSASAIAEGNHNFTAQQEDPAGNTSSLSATLGVVVVDTMDPSQPTLPDLQPASDTGDSDMDNITATDSPSFNVECSGAGAVITLYVDGAASGTHTCVGTATETAAITSPISDGTVTVTYSETDLAGNEGLQSTGLGITIDTDAPADPAAAPDMQAGSDTGTLDTDNNTSDNTPTLDVECIAGESVNIYSDSPSANTLVGTHLCVGGGTEAVAITTPLNDGPQNITYTLEDAAGAESSQSPEIPVVIDTTDPLSPTVDTPTDGSTIGDTTPTVSGSGATPGDTITVTGPLGETCSAVVDSAGDWSCDIATALPENTPQTLTVTTEDPAGNVGPTASIDIIVDTTPPTDPTVSPDLGSGSDTGPVDTDDYTADNTPTFEVNCTEVGNIVTLYVDGVATETLTCTLDDVNDDPEPTITISSPLSDGPYTITTTEADPSGNTSASSPPLPITIDTSAPAPTINGPTAGAPVTGTAEPGSTVTVDTPGGATCTVTVAATGFYTCPLDVTPVDGEDITAVITDLAGNASVITTETGGIDLSIPSDNDGDGISDTVEDAVAPAGDGNGDGILDSLQSEVTSVANPETGAYTTLEAANGCTVIGGYEVVAESSLAVQDEVFDYPVGLNDFTLNCVNDGDSSDVTYYYDQLYDTSEWTFKKFDDTGDVYSDISHLVTYGTDTVNGVTVTTAKYTVTDGGITDTDGVANGVIVDPAGPAVAGSIPVYRFWSDTYRSHFYTKDIVERDQVIDIYDDIIWRYEGIGFHAFETDTTNRSVVYRFWSPVNRSHFYTINETEKTATEANPEWDYEGPEWYAYPAQESGSLTMHRFWSENYKSHFYTVNEAEKDSVINSNSNWSYEGEVYYVPAS